MKLPVSENAKARLLQDGGTFKYAVNVIDSPAGSKYGLDQARLAEGIEVEGCNLDDFIVLTDGANKVDGSPDIKVKLSSNAPTAAPDTPAVTPDPDNNQQNQESGSNGSSTTPTTPTTGDKTNSSAAQTGDVGIAVAASALVAAAGFVVIKKRK